MRKTGTLTIDDGISRLGGTRLMKGAVNSGGFARATNFLQDRGLSSGNIWVDGVDDLFGEMPVIVITDAGRGPGPDGSEHTALAGDATVGANRTGREASASEGSEASEKATPPAGGGNKKKKSSTGGSGAK